MKRQFTLLGQTHEAAPLEAGLFVVATPIGNLGDVTLRALQTLAAADIAACEDTRVTARLFARYGIETPRTAYTEHNAERAGPALLDRIEAGGAVALVSDAGTPLVSDPGQRLVAETIARGLDVVPLPGASAPLAALVASGFATETFAFAGFLPGKRKALIDWADTLGDGTVLAFEAPTRIAASLAVLADALGGGRRAVVSREISKLHEEHHRGTLDELAAEFAAMDRVRGEIVLTIEGAPAGNDAWDEAAVDAALRDALATMRTKDAADQVAAMTGRSRKELYARALALKDG